VERSIVFLDIDGVLNSAQWYAQAGSRGEKGPSGTSTERELLERSIDPACVKRLNLLLQRTGAAVIVSSSWRKKHGLSEIVSIMEARGFCGEVIGTTSSGDGTLSRGGEITTWLKKNLPLGAAYVVVDDEVETGLPAEVVVVTSNDTGLTDEDVDRAIAILSRQSEKRENTFG
jgi:HAD domain in Swiss Army Knife RNA repair proteins